MKIVHGNLGQIYAAREVLKNAVIYGQQLCTKVDQIEYAGQIERFGMLHYIFKFREPGGPWLIGVSGGYTDDAQIEPGEYVGSMGDAYNEATAQGAAAAILDDMKQYFDGLDEEEDEDGEEEEDAPDLDLSEEDMEEIMNHVREQMKARGMPVDNETIRATLQEVLSPQYVQTMKEQTIVQDLLLTDTRWHGDALMKHLQKEFVIDKTAGSFFMKRKKLGFAVDGFSITCALENRGEESEYIEGEAREEGPDSEELKIAKAYRAYLRVTCFHETEPRSNSGIVLAAAMQACLNFYGKAALGVNGQSGLRSADAYRQILAKTRREQCYPLEAFVNAVADCLYKNAYKVYTLGMELFNLRNIECARQCSKIRSVKMKDYLLQAADQIFHDPDSYDRGGAVTMKDGTVWRVKIRYSDYLEEEVYMLTPKTR